MELRNDIEFDRLSLVDPIGGGPASKVGLLPGDRILGVNGIPFLKGRVVVTSSTDADSSSNDVNLKSRCSQQQTISLEEEMLTSVGDIISTSKSPMAIHIQRVEDDERCRIIELLDRAQRKSAARKAKTTSTTSNGISLQTPSHVNRDMRPNKAIPITKHQKPKRPRIRIHPFAKSLSSRSIIKPSEEITITNQLSIYTERTRQWESKLSFKLRAMDYALRPILDVRDVEPSYYASFITDDGDTIPPYFDYKGSKNVRNYAPSTPMIQDWRLNNQVDGYNNTMASQQRVVGQELSKEAAIMADLYAGLDDDDRSVQDMILGGSTASSSNGSGGGGLAYPANNNTANSLMRAISSDPTDIFVPLMNVRKAICIRILNTFLDSKNRTAFTIWCYDVESGK